MQRVNLGCVCFRGPRDVAAPRQDDEDGAPPALCNLIAWGDTIIAKTEIKTASSSSLIIVSSQLERGCE